MGYDHIDLRAPQLGEVAPFYERLLPVLGFTRRVPVEGWLQFESTKDGVGEFFGVTESSGHQPNQNRIAFRAESKAEVDRLGEVVRACGGRNIEGPMDYEPRYYALFFEDPCGNRFEICHRWVDEAGR